MPVFDWNWTLSAPLKTHWLLTDTKVPTGQAESAENFFGGDSHSCRFADKPIDNVFSDIERDAKGRVTTTFKGASQSNQSERRAELQGLRSLFHLTDATQYQCRSWRRQSAAAGQHRPGHPKQRRRHGPAPWDRGFLAIEPYANITNALNMAQKGTSNELQSIPVGGHWEESFWVTPSGY